MRPPPHASQTGPSGRAKQSRQRLGVMGLRPVPRQRTVALCEAWRVQPAGHNQAAPRTPLLSPWTLRTTGVAVTSLNT